MGTDLEEIFEEGRKEGIKETILEMLKEKMPIETIAKVTKLNLNEVREIEKTLVAEV